MYTKPNLKVKTVSASMAFNKMTDAYYAAIKQCDKKEIYM